MEQKNKRTNSNRSRASRNKTSQRKKSSSKGLTIKAKTANRIKMLAVIFVILLLVAIAAAKVGGFTLSAIGDSLRTSFAKIGSGDGYPYSLSGMSVSDITITNTDLVLLNDNSIRVIDSTAKEISNIQHSFDHPVMQSSSGRILVYDIGAKNFRIQSKTRVLFEKQTDHMILTASIGRDGSVAVATRADGAESMLTVYDKNHKETFKWACAKEHIVSCDVSDNGRMFVVAVLGINNGSVYSKVYIFEKNKTEAQASFDYEDCALTSVQFLSNETVMVLGNNICEIIKGDEVKEKVDVSVNTPSRLYISDNNTAVLVLSKYSSTTQKIIKVYSKSGTECFTSEVDGIVKSVSTDGKYVAVLTDSQVCIYNMKGEMCGKADVNSDATDVAVYSRRTYVFSSESISEYSSVDIS